MKVIVHVMAAAFVCGTVAPPAAEAQITAGQGVVAEYDSTYGCLLCHADKRRAFLQGIHSERGIRCHDCHGGNPESFETAPAHRGRFVGVPTKVETIQLCSACHADPDHMRQYGIAADQLAEFRTSRHGELLLGRGNTDAPTCTDCHDAHTILPPTDARSGVHPTNIPATCGTCHEDETLMGRYGLPTDQLRRYREGAHGEAVFERHNFASPTCIGCHGSHAALPPKVSEIVHVCDHCHVTLGRAFYEGPHGEPALSGAIPGCLGCHSNHGTERIPAEEIAALCTGCHPADSRQAQLGVQIQERVVSAADALHEATEAIEEMERSGHNVADERFRYQAALTAFRQLAQVQHSLDLEQLETLELRVRSNTGVIRGTAEARAEESWEHKLILVPVWFLALSVLALGLFKWRELGR
ncbi:MAG: cytochrome c3 family protein [Gemmatimonadales bacterium]|jgi:predicted CXXCH cytochrome family protein